MDCEEKSKWWIGVREEDAGVLRGGIWLAILSSKGLHYRQPMFANEDKDEEGIFCHLLGSIFLCESKKGAPFWRSAAAGNLGGEGWREGGRERGTERWMIQDEDAAVVLLGES